VIEEPVQAQEQETPRKRYFTVYMVFWYIYTIFDSDEVIYAFVFVFVFGFATFLLD
jgi:hypothetical protein